MLLLKDKKANLFSHLSLRKQFYEWKKTLNSTGEGVQGGIGELDADNKIGQYTAGDSKSCLHIVEECNKDFPWYETLKDLYLDHPVLDNSAVLNSQSARGLSFTSTPGNYQDDSSGNLSEGNGSDPEVIGGDQPEDEDEDGEEDDMEKAEDDEEKEEERDKKEKKGDGDQKGKGRKFVKSSDDESANDEPPRKKAKKIEEKVSNHYEKYDFTHLFYR